MRQILLQNATAILLQNASGFLLQNATVLLQNSLILLQNATVATSITKCVGTVTDLRISVVQISKENMELFVLMQSGLKVSNL